MVQIAYTLDTGIVGLIGIRKGSGIHSAQRTYFGQYLYNFCNMKNLKWTQGFFGFLGFLAFRPLQKVIGRKQCGSCFLSGLFILSRRKRRSNRIGFYFYKNYHTEKLL